MFYYIPKLCYAHQLFSDGTLITQRMHYAPSPHPYRHVLGWYRLLQELKDSGVSAICVFDGKERNLAKAMEVRLCVDPGVAKC